MCGHDPIGVCTALVESGLIPVEPITLKARYASWLS